jgi:hypothetical protein
MEQGAPESTDELVEALVPHRYLHIYRSAPPEPLFVLTPLPPLVAARYTGGGCWNLALALHEQTRLPIELFYRDGKPRHAYVVAGDRTLDAFGWRLLRHARAGSEESLRVSPAALLELLGAITPGARDGLAAGAELISREEIKREFGLA